MRFFVCTIAKAKKAFGWKPKIKPRKGIEKLIRWINENRGVFGG